MDLVSLTIALVAGAVAGNILSAAMKQDAINLLGRTVFGAVGGVLGSLVFSFANGDGAISGALVDIYTGGFGGAILTAIAGAVISPVFSNRR